MKIRLTIILTICILIVGVVFIGSSIFSDNSEIAAEVNGVPIYRYEIERVLNLYVDSELTYDSVVNSAVREELVIQAAKENGLGISDKDLEKKMAEYKIAFPKVYEKLVIQYGSEKKFAQSYAYLLDYNAMKESVIQGYKETMGLTDDQCSEDALESYFNSWVDSLLEDANIQYYK